MFLYAFYGEVMNNNSTAEIRPFRVEVAQADLDDLTSRLARTRLPVAAPGDNWELGTPNHYLHSMVEHWQHGFDWRAQESRMNAFPHYLTEIDGQTVHFIHIPSAEPGATPLLLAHSYPGSFIDFLDMIGPLTDPVAHGGRSEDAFSVVIPSIPGFGFSTPLTGRDWTMARVARTFDVLMRRLGYESYGSHGSDGGAMISRELGLLNPPGFLGLHVLQLFSFPSGDPAEFANFSPDDYAALEHLKWFQSVGGYNAPSIRPGRKPLPSASPIPPSASSPGTNCSTASETAPASSPATRSWPKCRSTGSPTPARPPAATTMKKPMPQPNPQSTAPLPG